MIAPITTPLFFWSLLLLGGLDDPQAARGRLPYQPRSGRSGRHGPRYDIITGELLSEAEADRRDWELRT